MRKKVKEIIDIIEADGWFSLAAKKEVISNTSIHQKPGLLQSLIMVKMKS